MEEEKMEKVQEKEEEKNLTGLDAVTLEELHRMVSYHRETYWRYYMMWHEHWQLNDRDPDEFYKRESESGMAMFDDPPEGWTKDQLHKWSLGNTHGREVETGNIFGVLRHIECRMKQLLDKDNFGFRTECPTPNQVEAHCCQSLIGMWILNYEVKDNDMIPQAPISTCLEVKNGKIRYLDDYKWRIFTKKEQKKIVSYMPLSQTGLPASWLKEKS